MTNFGPGARAPRRAHLAQGLLVAAGLAVSGSAMALELGTLQLHRSPGQAPYAEVPVLDAVPGDPATIRARLATPDGYRVAGMRYVPALRSISITPQAAAGGKLNLRIDNLPAGAEAGELDLLLLVGDRVSLTLNEYRLDLRSAAREFAPAQAGTRLAGQQPTAPVATQAPRAVAAAPAPSVTAVAPAPRPTAAAPAVVAAAPVVAQPTTPAAPAPAGADAALVAQAQEALNAWARAWASRNIDAYVGAYVPTYAPPGKRQSHDEWVEFRRSRIVPRQSIEVALSDVRVTRRGENLVAVFDQRYRGDGYSEKSRKQIVLTRERDRWLIQEETELR